MNIAYIVHSGDFNAVVGTMLASLDRHCDCRLIVAAHQLHDTCEQWSAAFTKSIQFRRIADVDWVGCRMARKIWDLQSVPFDYGDKVFVLDTDLLIQANIFEAIDGTFDVGVTTRHYDYWYKVNGGVWAFEYNEHSRQFLDFFASQIRDPSWMPYVRFQERFQGRRHMRSYKSLDWWCDQDFLCTIHENELPFECNIHDLGSDYNFCPSVEDHVSGTFKIAREEILSRVGDTKIKVLHFKGQLKQVLEYEVGPELYPQAVMISAHSVVHS